MALHAALGGKYKRGIAMVAGAYARHAYDPNHPFAIMLATALVAVVAGGSGGLLLALLAERLVVRTARSS